MAHIPTSEPVKLNAGDTWRWTRALPDYPADAWVLKYRLKSATGGVEFTAVADGAVHSIAVSAGVTEDVAPGRYQWQAWVEAGDLRVTVGRGDVEVLPNLRGNEPGTSLDARTHARRTLDAIEAVLESRASMDQMAYAINGRSLSRTPIADLLKLRRLYADEVRAEEAGRRLAAGGRGVRSRLRIAFQ